MKYLGLAFQMKDHIGNAIYINKKSYVNFVLRESVTINTLKGFVKKGTLNSQEGDSLLMKVRLMDMIYSGKDELELPNERKLSNLKLTDEKKIKKLAYDFFREQTNKGEKCKEQTVFEIAKIWENFKPNLPPEGEEK